MMTGSRIRLRHLIAVAVAVLGLGFGAAQAADDEIVWGGAVPLTGPFAKAGQLGLKGLQANVAWVNAHGGINGRPVRLVIQDSGYVPDKALAIFKQIMASENATVFYGDSTGFAKLVAPELNERYKVLVGGTSFSSDLADPVKHPFQFMVGPTYADQIGILLEYIAAHPKSDGSKPSVGLFYSNTEFGRDPIAAAKERAAKLGLDIVVEIETKPAGIDVGPEVLKLRQANPDYVIFHGFVTSVWPQVMVQARQSGMETIFMGTYWAMEPMVVKELGPLADGYMGVFPYRYYWEQEESTTLQAMKAATKAPYLPTYFLQTWFTGMVFTEVIKRTLDAGKPLTGENLKAAFDSIKDWDTGGLIGVPVTFKNNSIPIARIYKGNSKTQRMDPVSDWIILE